MDAFTIQRYWENELGDLYNLWYNWFLSGEPAGIIAQIINHFIRRKKSEIKILDCACGTGNPSFLLKKMGFDVLSSDGSRKMLMKAAKNAQEARIDLNLVKRPVLWCELGNLFSKQEFDVVVCTGNSMCHVPPSGVRIAIEQISQILRVHGLCIIDVKRYNERIRELDYDEERGWTERTRRIDNRYSPCREPVQFVSELSYVGDDVPGRTYNIHLEVKPNGYESNSFVFPVWAITAPIVLSHLEEFGMTTHFDQTTLPMKWKYDFCVGVKK